MAATNRPKKASAKRMSTQAPPQRGSKKTAAEAPSEPANESDGGPAGKKFSKKKSAKKQAIAKPAAVTVAAGLPVETPAAPPKPGTSKKKAAAKKAAAKQPAPVEPPPQQVFNPNAAASRPTRSAGGPADRSDLDLRFTSKKKSKKKKTPSATAPAAAEASIAGEAPAKKLSKKKAATSKKTSTSKKAATSKKAGSAQTTGAKPPDKHTRELAKKKAAREREQARKQKQREREQAKKKAAREREREREEAKKQREQERKKKEREEKAERKAERERQNAEKREERARQQAERLEARRKKVAARIDARKRKAAERAAKRAASKQAAEATNQDTAAIEQHDADTEAPSVIEAEVVEPREEVAAELPDAVRELLTEIGEQLDTFENHRVRAKQLRKSLRQLDFSDAAQAPDAARAVLALFNRDGDPHNLRSHLLLALERMPEHAYFEAFIEAIPRLYDEAPEWAFAAMMRLINTRGSADDSATRFEQAVDAAGDEIANLVIEILAEGAAELPREMASMINQTIRNLGGE